MRRLLALLLALSPAAARSQSAGQILFDGYTAGTINKAACQSTNTVDLSWKVSEQTTGAFVSGTGKYEVHSANQDKTTSGSFPPCYVAGDGSAATAGLVATLLAPTGTSVTAQPVKMADLVTAAGYTCADNDKTLYVCVVWRDDSSNVKAYAKGSLRLLVIPPGKPTITSVTAGDGALNVAITPAAADAAAGVPAAVTWIAAARAVDTTADPLWHYSKEVSVGEKARIEGLVNGRTYNVTAGALSEERNVSADADWVQGTPEQVEDAWRLYKDSGGRDSGGCASGPAGLAALLGAAALLRLRRRP
ncbi:MAG TPA: hypothetical protein VLT47_08050 [Anaeromyxobacteraceae bacterium]|nr:hypothetical protein [Anaeromyxobacteraceae bacterium]